MGNKINDPIARLMGLRYKSHPWHGIEVGEKAPEVITAFIEMVPTDTVKYELDKVSGYLKIDRPQKYSNVIPALYGFVPQSFCGESVAEYCMQQTDRKEGNDDSEGNRHFRTYHNCHNASENYHKRATDSSSYYHHIGHLHVCNVGCKTRDKSGGGEFVYV